MKKILAMILAMVMALSLAACGKTEQKDEKKDDAAAAKTFIMGIDAVSTSLSICYKTPRSNGKPIAFLGTGLPI